MGLILLVPLFLGLRQVAIARHPNKHGHKHVSAGWWTTTCATCKGTRVARADAPPARPDQG